MSERLIRCGRGGGYIMVTRKLTQQYNTSNKSKLICRGKT